MWFQIHDWLFRKFFQEHHFMLPSSHLPMLEIFAAILRGAVSHRYTHRPIDPHSDCCFQ